MTGAINAVGSWVFSNKLKSRIANFIFMSKGFKEECELIISIPPSSKAPRLSIKISDNNGKELGHLHLPDIETNDQAIVRIPARLKIKDLGKGRGSCSLVLKLLDTSIK